MLLKPVEKVNATKIVGLVELWAAQSDPLDLIHESEVQSDRLLVGNATPSLLLKNVC
jgi:hypothetical protein